MDLENNSHFQNPNFTSAWVWGVPLIATILLMFLLVTGENIALFKTLNNHMAKFGDLFWGYLTTLGDTSLALMFILPLFGRRPALVWQFFMAAIFATLWSHGMKDLFSSLRPPAILPAESFHLIGPMFEQNSFPSGHTTTIFVLAGLICLQFINNKIKVLMLTLAILVGLSRIACGVHWPVDVLGGVIGGWLSAEAAVWLCPRWTIGMNVWFQRTLALLVTISAGWSILFYDSQIPGTRPFLIIMTLICLGLSFKGQYKLFVVK